MKDLEKIENRKNNIGSRNDRKLKKYSTNFNQMFSFFLQSYRKGILTFCGSSVDVKFDINSNEGKFSFREFENGRFRDKEFVSRHSNVFRSCIIGKKSWGLFSKEWSMGIAEGLFLKKEILYEFEKNNISIPDSLLKELENKIYYETKKRIDKMITNNH